MRTQSADVHPLDRRQLLRQVRIVRMRPESRRQVARFQRLFLKGFAVQLGAFILAIPVGMAADPFHAKSDVGLVAFLGLLLLSVIGTVVTMVAMHRRESYLTLVAKRELAQKGTSGS